MNNNKKWESRMFNLLHSLNIQTGKNINEVDRFASSSEELDEKLSDISSKYDKSVVDDFNYFNDKEFDLDDNHDDYTGDVDPNDIPDILSKFFSELKEDGHKSKFNSINPLEDAVLNWIYQLLLLNDGKFKIQKLTNGSVVLEFESDEIIENDKIVSLTDEFASEIYKINKKSVIYTKSNKQPSKSNKSSQNKTEKNGTESKSRTTRQRKSNQQKNSKNKDTE